jgi:hypothetical protein
LQDNEDVRADIDSAIADHIIHPDRDATLVQTLREQVDAEPKRPSANRNNVFLMQFTTLGARIVSFLARTKTELHTQLEETSRFIRAQEQAVDLSPEICVGEWLNHRSASVAISRVLGDKRGEW